MDISFPNPVSGCFYQCTKRASLSRSESSTAFLEEMSRTTASSLSVPLMVAFFRCTSSQKMEPSRCLAFHSNSCGGPLAASCMRRMASSRENIGSQGSGYFQATVAEFFTGIAEHFAGLAIDIEDFSLFHIMNENTVIYRIEYGMVICFRGFEGRFRLFPSVMSWTILK